MLKKVKDGSLAASRLVVSENIIKKEDSVKRIMAAGAIVALIFALGCPSKKTEEQPKPAAAESTMQAPAPESATTQMPAETTVAPTPAPTPAPAPAPETGKPPKTGR